MHTTRLLKFLSPPFGFLKSQEHSKNKIVIVKKIEGDRVQGDDKPKHNTGVLSVCLMLLEYNFFTLFPFLCVIRSSKMLKKDK
jgi:hypothetical protein